MFEYKYKEEKPIESISYKADDDSNPINLEMSDGSIQIGVYYEGKNFYSYISRKDIPEFIEALQRLVK